MAYNGKKLYNNNQNRNNQFQNSKPPLNNQNKNNDGDDDDDFLDISDNELIRASQVVESQLKFTNNVHHTTKDALNIFSQFNNDIQQSQFQSQMCAPNMTIMGHPTKAPIYGSQMTPLEALSQLDDAKCELKSVKDQKMMKDGEVKILRDKLKKQDQDLQRIRTEKLDLMKKLQLQQVEAKKNLDKQLEFKELENQFKSQELADISIKYKQLEARIKKLQSSSGSITFTGIKPEPSHQYSNNMSSQNIFDEEFSRKKSGFQQQPPLNPNPAINIKNHGTKRLAQSPTDSIFLSDGENENPIKTVHENKRPSLQTIEKDPKVNSMSVNQPTRSHLSSINTNLNYSTPNLLSDTKKEQPKIQTLNQVNQANTSLPSHPNNPIQTVPFQPIQSISAISSPKIQSKPHTEPTVVYKRGAKLNLKSFHKIKLSGDKFVTANLDNSFSSDPIKLKSYANDNIYKLIDLFSESANNLNKFNSTTLNEEAYEGTESFALNTNATSLNIQNLSKQLNDLLGFISYKSSTSPITNDLFSSFITASLTESSISASSSSNNSLLIIDRVEFVSKNLNKELVDLIQYCLNASLTQNGEVSLSSGSESNDLQGARNSFHSDFNLAASNDPSRRVAYGFKEKIVPASDNSITDLICCSFEVCVSLFLFRASLLIINYSQNEQNKKTYKLIKSKQLNNNQQLSIHRKLMKLKKEFFRLVKLLLNSINFSSISINFATTVFDQNEYNRLESLSTSSSPYSALKILSSVLDCLNYFVYLPVMYQRDEPNSIITWFYYSLVDHMHNIYKQKMNLSETCQDPKKPDQEANVKMEQDNDIIQIDLEEIVDVQGEEVMDAEFDSDYNNEEEPCLFQLFYQKLIKYFGDIAYALESSEARLQYSIEENAALISSITAASSTLSSYPKLQADNSDVNSIITTIADDNKRELNFSLENKPQTTALPYSKSQNDLQLELLQTQISTEDVKKHKTNHPANPQTNLNSESNNLERCRKYLKNRTNSDCIQLLKTRLMSSYIYFLHNFQLVSRMESKICSRVEPGQETNSKKCMCYKDMINSLIILIDYQFNEKFFYGADLSFNQCFLSKLTANCLFFPNQIKNDRYKPGNKENIEIKSEDINIEKKILRTNKSYKNFSSALCNLKEKSNQFQFLLIIRCSFALNTLLKNPLISIDQQADDSRLKFFESVREDYRLKNFYCLYMLVDLIYEEFIKQSTSLPRLDDSSNYTISKKSSANHLLSTVNHIKNVFKVEEYFDLE